MFCQLSSLCLLSLRVNLANHCHRNELKDAEEYADHECVAQCALKIVFIVDVRQNEAIET